MLTDILGLLSFSGTCSSISSGWFNRYAARYILNASFSFSDCIPPDADKDFFVIFIGGLLI